MRVRSHGVASVLGWMLCCAGCCVLGRPRRYAVEHSLEARFSGYKAGQHWHHMIGHRSVHTTGIDALAATLYCLPSAAVLRYEISHPVVNDGNMTLWRGLGVSSWPTLAVVSPRGRVIAMLPGEGHRQDVDDILAAALEVCACESEVHQSTLCNCNCVKL